MNFPGEEEAKKLGYSLYSHSGDKSSASYSKEKLCLTVYKSGDARLSSYYKLIRLESGKFSFPHENFHIFENQIIELLNGVE
jgi:hypothetical protein